MDPHTLIPILTSIGIKYLINIGNWLEDITQVDLPNLGKQAAVVVLAYLATKIPQIQQYLPQITPWAQTGLIAVLTTLGHHLIQLVVAAEKQLGAAVKVKKAR